MGCGAKCSDGGVRRSELERAPRGIDRCARQVQQGMNLRTTRTLLVSLLSLLCISPNTEVGVAGRDYSNQRTLANHARVGCAAAATAKRYKSQENPNSPALLTSTCSGRPVLRNRPTNPRMLSMLERSSGNASTAAPGTFRRMSSQAAAAWEAIGGHHGSNGSCSPSCVSLRPQVTRTTYEPHTANLERFSF